MCAFEKKNVSLDYIPVTQRKDVQDELAVLSTHQCHAKGVSADTFLQDLPALCYPQLEDNGAGTKRRVQKVLLNHQGCRG